MASGHVLTFPGTRAGFERGFADLRRVLDRHHLHAKVRYSCELTFEEIVTNIVKYAYADDQEHSIAVSVDARSDEIILTFEDDGVAFDPLNGPAAGLSLAQPSAGIGGRGLVLVRFAARHIHYERTSNGSNRLEVTVGPK